MKFVLAAGGSRGDVQPMVAIATELRSRGYDVALLVPPNLVDFAAGAGVPTHPYGEDTAAVLTSDLVREGMKSRNPRTRLRAIAEVTVAGGRSMQETLLRYARDADAIIATSVGQERAHNVSQVLGIAHIPVHLCPIRQNRSVSLLAHFGIDAPGPIAAASWRLLEWVLWLGSRRAEDTLRADLDLPRTRRPFASMIAETASPEIQAYDPALFPSLADEWGARRPLVGFLNLAPEFREAVGDVRDDSTLDAWLADGAAPVYVGFGSMSPSDPAALAAALLAAATEYDVRLLVSGGWSGFMAAIDDPRIHTVGHVDHDAVLPRCRAAVHHGGAGSVAAGLRAGLPTAVLWVGADQPLWGQAIAGAHVGTSIPMGRADTARLTQALATVCASTTRTSAQRLGARLIAPEHAVARAVDLAEQAASRQHPA